MGDAFAPGVNFREARQCESNDLAVLGVVLQTTYGKRAINSLIFIAPTTGQTVGKHMLKIPPFSPREGTAEQTSRVDAKLILPSTSENTGQVYHQPACNLAAYDRQLSAFLNKRYSRSAL